MYLGPRGAAELQTHPSLNAIAIVPSGWMVAWSTNEGSPGFGRVADCRVLTAVLVERGDGRTLGFEFV